jgi:selenium metabolism protein YedF
METSERTINVKKAQIDARGKNCPEPVIMTKNAILPDVVELETLVDNPIAQENVSRFMKKRGFRVESMEKDGTITVRGYLEKEANPVSVEAVLDTMDFAVLITHSLIGREDEELGEVLMKAYLSSLGQGTMLPSVIILMNGGVKLAISGTSSCEHLEDLVSKGVNILVCGTCLKHFNLLDRLGIGQVSNMFEISDALAAASHVISF